MRAHRKSTDSHVIMRSSHHKVSTMYYIHTFISSDIPSLIFSVV